MPTTVVAELKQAEDAVNEVKRILSKYGFSDEEWSTVVIGFIAQAIEHHEAILLLLRSGLVGSGFALLRPLVSCIINVFTNRQGCCIVDSLCRCLPHPLFV